MTSLLFFLLCSFAHAADDFWEDQLDFYLDTGVNITCLPLTKAYQSICSGTSCQMNFKHFHNIGHTQIVYTFNLYYQALSNVKFQENGQTLSKDNLNPNSNSHLSTFQYCNLNYDVKYFKIISNLNHNANSLSFSITLDKPSQFIITTLKIYVYRCQKYCLMCDNINQKCSQCKPGFSVDNSQMCACPYQTPFIFQDQCVNQCPNGFYPQFQYCVPCQKVENILFDDQANSFILIKDFNTTDRLTSFTDNGKVLAGLFIQNEAIMYSLPQSISTITDLQLVMEIYFINLEQQVIFSVKFDDYIYYQKFLDPKFHQHTGQEILSESCSILGNSNCLLYLINLFIPQIDKLKQITLSLNIPLHSQKTAWALSQIQLNRIEQMPKTPCFQKQFYETCVQDCPPTTKQVGSNCQNITTLYPYAKIAKEFFTKSSINQDLYEGTNFDLLCNNPLNCTFQFYSNQYIYGGHRIWNSQMHTLNLDSLNTIHYKAKIYMKILLIDPLNDLDTFTLFIEDKRYEISRSHINSTCINNAGSGTCLKQEDIGTVATDYIIQIEIETVHVINSLTLGFKCNANSNDFYCAFYDLIVLLAKCPFNCLQCSSNINCVIEVNPSLKKNFYDSCPEQYYYYDGDCVACQNYCKQCNQEKCLVCHDKYEMIGEICICKNNRVNAEYTRCYDYCYDSCSICLDIKKFNQDNHIKPYSNSTCLSCNIQEKKILSGVECICLDGYFMDTSTIFYQCKQCNQICKTCNEGQNCLTCDSEQKREIYDNKCICQQGYYETEKDTLICQSCSSICKTCVYSVDICTSCYINQFRVLSNQNTCDCQLGYFEDNNKCCQKCNNSCETCLNMNTCLSCDDNQFRQLNNNNQCECIENYYENENNECLQCFYTCSKCNNNDNPNNCTQCPQTRMKNSNLLNTFECQCKKGFYDFGELQCLSCQDLLNPPQTHYCYSKCGDSIVQWNEECDDGNMNPRDECDQCYFPISSCTNNLNCINCQLNKCIECIQGYYINQENKCEQCADQCLSCSDSKQMCNECKYNNEQNKNCILCQLQEGYQDIDGKCYSICGDGIKTAEEECDDGNLLNSDGCNQYCLIEQGFQCHSSCAIKQSIKIILQESEDDSIYDNKRKVFLFFNELIHVESNKKLKDLILVSPVQEDLRIYNINIIDNTNYSQYFNEIRMTIEFEILESYNKPQVKIEFENSTLISNQQFELQSNLTKSIKVIDFLKQSMQQLELVQKASQTINYLFQLMIGLVSSSLIFGGFDNFMNFFEILQFISYLKYINIQYPQRIQQYFQLFSFVELNFIREFINNIGSFQNSSNCYPTLLKFSKEGYTTIFLYNMLPVFTIFAFLFAIYVLIKILLYSVKKLIQQNQKIHKTKSTLINKSQLFLEKLLHRIFKFLFLIIYFFPQIITRTYILFTYNINVSIFLQIQGLQINSYYLALNSILSLICLAIQFYILGIGKVFQSKKFKKQQTTKYQQNNVRQFFNSFRETFSSLILKQFSFLRKLMLIGFLVMAYEQPYYQIINLLGLNLIGCAFLTKSYIAAQSNRIKDMIIDVIFIIILILILLIALNRKFSFIESSFIGQADWIIISMLNFAVILEFIFSIFSYAQFILNKYCIIIKIRQIFQQLFTELTENDEILDSQVQDQNLFKLKSPTAFEGRKMVSFSLQQGNY